MDDEQSDRDTLVAGRAERLAADRERDAACVARVRDGDHAAFTELYDAWFPRVYVVARRIVGDDAVAEEVAQDAVTAAWRKLDTLSDPASFGGWLLRITRNRALDRSERERRSAPVDAEGLAVIEASRRGTSGAPGGFGAEDRLGDMADPARVAEDNEVVALLWDAAAALGERDTTVLDLQLRHGLGPAEIGEVMGLNRNAANQLVHRVKGRLRGAVRARLLWRGGSPRCDDLAAVLGQAGVSAFGSEAMAVIDQHVPRCGECGDQGRTAVAPAALFAALPLAVPPGARDRVAAALVEAGVPVGSGARPAGDGSRDGGGTPPRPVPPAGGPGRAGVLVGALVVLLLLAGALGTSLLAGDTEPEAGGDVAAGSESGGAEAPVGGATPAADGEVGDDPPATTPAGAPSDDPAGGDGSDDESPAEPGATTPTSPPTTSAPGATAGTGEPLALPPTPAPAPPADPAPGVDAPPATVPPPAPPVISFSLAPGPTTVTGWAVAGSAAAEPHLTWSVSGAQRVVIRGHETDGSLTRSSSGRLDVCPNGLSADGFCNAGSATYTYELVVLGLDGSLTSRTVTLIVLDPLPQ